MIWSVFWIQLTISAVETMHWRDSITEAEKRVKISCDSFLRLGLTGIAGQLEENNGMWGIAQSRIGKKWWCIPWGMAGVLEREDQWMGAKLHSTYKSVLHCCFWPFHFPPTLSSWTWCLISLFTLTLALLQDELYLTFGLRLHLMHYNNNLLQSSCIHTRMWTHVNSRFVQKEFAL